MIGIDQKPLSSLLKIRTFMTSSVRLVIFYDWDIFSWRHKDSSRRTLVNSETKRWYITVRRDHQDVPWAKVTANRQWTQKVRASYGTLLYWKHISKKRKKTVNAVYPNPKRLFDHAKQKSCGIDELKEFRSWRKPGRHRKPASLTVVSPDRCTNQVRSAEFNWLQPVSQSVVSPSGALNSACHKQTPAAVFFFLHSRCPLDHRDSFCVSNIFNPYTYWFDVCVHVHRNA